MALFDLWCYIMTSVKESNAIELWPNVLHDIEKKAQCLYFNFQFHPSYF
jgi:hypothetical protein